MTVHNVKMGKLNNIAFDNYSKTIMKVRTQQAEVTSLKPYLEYFSSLTLKAYFTSNNMVTPILPIYTNRNIITIGDMINEINYPTIAGGYLNNAVIKDRIPKQIFKGKDMCRAKGVNIAVGNEITLPNCTNSSWTTDNTASKNIRLALIKTNLISHDIWYLQDKFGFSDEEMQSVPQAPFKYKWETFKDTAFRAS